MSGKFVIKKERSKYRFDILDESGEVVFKGAIGSTKDAVIRKINLIQSFGLREGGRAGPRSRCDSSWIWHGSGNPRRGAQDQGCHSEGV